MSDEDRLTFLVEFKKISREYYEKWECYVSGYYSPAESKNRFEAMPDTLDLML